jgi:hypothetical protein
MLLIQILIGLVCHLKMDCSSQLNSTWWGRGNRRAGGQSEVLGSISDTGLAQTQIDYVSMLIGFLCKNEAGWLIFEPRYAHDPLYVPPRANFGA